MEQPVSSGHAYPRETEKHATCRSHDEVTFPVTGQQSVVDFGRPHMNAEAFRRADLGLGVSALLTLA
jgi:hypothetical protein